MESCIAQLQRQTRCKNVTGDSDSESLSSEPQKQTPSREEFRSGRCFRHDISLCRRLGEGVDNESHRLNRTVQNNDSNYEAVMQWSTNQANVGQSGELHS